MSAVKVPGRVSVQNQIVYSHTTYSHSAIRVDIVWVSGHVSVYRTRLVIIVVTHPCLLGWVLFSSWTCIYVQNQIVFLSLYYSTSAVSAWLRAVQFLNMCLCTEPDCFLSLYYSTSAVSSWLGAVQVPEHVSVYRTRWIIIVVTQLCLHGWLLFRFLDMCLCTEPDRLSL